MRSRSGGARLPPFDRIVATDSDAHMPPESIIVFVNAQRVDVPPRATALDAVRALSPDIAEQIVTGSRQLADARGLPIGADTPVYGGAIFRVIGGKRGVAASSGDGET